MEIICFPSIRKPEFAPLHPPPDWDSCLVQLHMLSQQHVHKLEVHLHTHFAYLFFFSLDPLNWDYIFNRG